MTIAQHDTEHYLETARELAAKVTPHVSQIEADRQFPSELSAAIADQGFFRLLIPRSMGGEEIDHPTFRKILEIFAEVDASTAWAINQNNVFATDVMKMPEEIANEILDARRTAMACFGDDWGRPGSIALKFLGCRWMLQWLPAPLRKKGAPFHGACGFRHSFYHTSWGAPFYARLEL